MSRFNTVIVSICYTENGFKYTAEFSQYLETNKKRKARR